VLAPSRIPAGRRPDVGESWGGMARSMGVINAQSAMCGRPVLDVMGSHGYGTIDDR
jgi:hypothetical protein